MTDFWLDHLSSTLEDNNIIAYTWHVSEDHFKWAGAMARFFDPNMQGGCPVRNSQFNKMINPQDVAGRLTALHDMLDRHAQMDGPFSFSVSYKLRQANGAYVEIEETASLQIDPPSGEKIICGVLKPRTGAAPVIAASGHADNVVPASGMLGHVTHGRRELERKIEEWFDTYEPETHSYGYVLSVGIDRMALFNDVMGPRYADELLEHTGDRLRKIVGESGSVMRINGDVFGIFFRQAPHNEMAAVAQYILNNFYNVPFQTSAGPMGISISIGGVVLKKNREPQSIIVMAEMAMNVAKDKGRSCFVSYEEASFKAENNRSLLKSADVFLRAMKSDRLRLAFQPVIASKTNDICFHESLIRLINENGELMPAGSFMPAIEELGLARIVDQYALRMAIRELDMFSDLQLSVNVSNLTLNNSDWLRGLVAALRDRPSVAQRLIVEITESAVINDLGSTKRIVKTLQELGCRVALDDFGAGYTAFSQLKDLKVDIVKIDKSFIRNINSEHNHLFVQTLQKLASGVNIKTVGEGAETHAEAKLLSDDGVDYIQGYVYGFPRVERLWLPKNHSHRKIQTELIQTRTAGRDGLPEEELENIETWQRTYAG